MASYVVRWLLAGISIAAYILRKHFVTLHAYLSGERGQHMIKCHLSRLMGERKMKIADVARETGLNRNTVTLLYKETANRVELDVIERLCGLFQCEVGELLEYVSDETEER